MQFVIGRANGPVPTRGKDMGSSRNRIGMARHAQAPGQTAQVDHCVTRQPRHEPALRRTRFARVLRLAMGGAVLACAGSALAADWYAAPTGGGSLCSQASPCTIQGAIDVAAPYDTVHVAPGDYTFTSNRILIQTEGLRLIGDNSPFAQPYATPPGPGQVAHGTLNNKAANASVLKAASANVASGTSGMIWVRNVQNVRIENLYIEMAQARAKEGIVATGTVRGLELVNNYIKTVSGASGVGISINMDAGTNSSVPSGESRGAGEFVTVDGNVVEPTPPPEPITQIDLPSILRSSEWLMARLMATRRSSAFSGFPASCRHPARWDMMIF